MSCSNDDAGPSCPKIRKIQNNKALINEEIVNLLTITYYFLLLIIRENIVFRSNFQSGDFDGFSRFQVP